MNRKERRRLVATGAAHEACRQELLAVLKRYTDDKNLPSEEVLALTANIVGMCLGMQNQLTMTHDRAWEIIARNIELGNQTVVSDLAGKTAGHS